MRSALALMFLGGMLAACGQSPGSQIFALSEDVQRDAIRQCKDERGVPGAYATGVFSYGSSRREVLIEPGNAVTVEDARAINSCAQAKMIALAAANSAQVSSQGRTLVETCVEQTQAPGAYDWKQQGDVPVVQSLTDLGGTPEGADMINACIRQNAVLFEDSGQTVAEIAPETVTPVDPLPTALPAAVPALPAARLGCPSGVTGLYRGNLVC